MKTFKHFFSSLIILICLVCCSSQFTFGQNYFAGSGAGTSNTGGQVTGVGYNTLHSSNSGIYNSAFGYNALYANTTGEKNTGIGANTLRFNIKGFYNTATGYAALYNNLDGSYNTAFGLYSLFSNQHASYNTAYGTYSLQANTSGAYNTAIGEQSMYLNQAGSRNTAIGFESLYDNNGNYNTAVGYTTLSFNTTGADNSASGYAALHRNISGSSNTASGEEALYYDSTGSFNTATGLESLFNNKTGNSNTASGYRSLITNTTGSNNTAIGDSADVISGALTNATAIGHNAIVDKSNKVRVGNSSVTSIGGHVGWTTFSDGRFKKDIKENVPGLEFINSLRPVTYTVNVKGINEYYNKGRKQINVENTVNVENKAARETMEKSEDAASKITYNGFVAQEVEGAAKKLNFEFSGVDKPDSKDGLYGLRYDNFIAPLVKAVQELSKINDEKDSKINNLGKRLTSLETLLSVKSSSSSPYNISLNTASLESNVPNPFTNTTTINYNLPQKYSTAKVVITDNSGKTIKEINISGSGKGSLNVDASTLAGSSYNYTLYVDSRLISTKQMILVK